MRGIKNDEENKEEEKRITGGKEEEKRKADLISKHVYISRSANKQKAGKWRRRKGSDT